MCLKSFFLFFLPVFPLVFCQQSEQHSPCTIYRGISQFVDSTVGQDSGTCDSRENPCRTISYAVTSAVHENQSSAVINISIGSYKEQNSINLDCSRWSLKRIAFWGERQGEQLVEVDLSLDVRLCELSMINLHWISSQAVSHNVLLSNFSLCESSVQGTEFSIIGKSSNVSLQRSSVSKSTGYQKLLPLMSLTSFLGYQNMLQIISCNFSGNTGPLVIVESTQASIIDSHLEGNKALFGRTLVISKFSHMNISRTTFVQNYGTVIRVQNSGSLNATNCLFQLNMDLTESIFIVQGLSTVRIKDCVFKDSRSDKEGPVLKISDRHSTAYFEKCNFSCNMVNRSIFSPPLLSQFVHQLSCDNCFVDHNCPVLCSPGEFLTSGVLCKSCPAGSYSPGATRNTSVTQCTSCPAGTYSSRTKTRSCTPCAEGTISSKAGSLLCSKCKNDFFTSSPGQASCSKVTMEFIILLAMVSTLTIIPIALLFWQSRPSAQKKKGPLLISSHEALTMPGAKDSPDFSIQNRPWHMGDS
ncbi:uncharacterized protein [Montipora capricornis]|uniref:uncharacterized protein isoform X2 n=1 Tax=Montipora capricornis TaxID=246305 RepID=UPI0035F1F3E6